MTGATYSWATAERRCNEYLADLLGGLEGVRWFDPQDYPRTVLLSTDADQWTFEITGGESPFVRSPAEQPNVRALWMLATFRGCFTSRSKAMIVAGEIWDGLPAGASTSPRLSGITQIQPTGYPSVVGEVRELTNDLETGGEVRVWTLTIPCWVVFGYLEQQT